MTDTTRIRSIFSASQEAETLIADTGGLPEITRASSDLRTALAQTATEIDGAVFSDRFPLEASDWFNTMSIHGANFTNSTVLAIQGEGEAGFKRAALQAQLSRIEGDLFGLLGELVELRCNLVVSQDDFSPTTEG